MLLKVHYDNMGILTFSVKGILFLVYYNYVLSGFQGKSPHGG